MNIMKTLDAIFRKNQKIDAKEAIAKMTDDEGYGRNRIKFYHLGERNHPHKGVMTIATQVMDDGELYIGLSYCSKKDHFVKAKGREIAFGRLQKGGAYHYHTGFTGNSGVDFKRIFNRGFDDSGKVIVKPQGFRKWYIACPTNGVGAGLTYATICS